MQGADAAAARREAILVVEDDIVTRLLLVEWLSAAGHRCLTAETAEQGWRVLKDSEDVWLVVVDVKMPGAYDGIDLLDCIAEMSVDRCVFCLFSFFGVVVDERGRRAGGCRW
jgi:DNA-binding NtrC family response regulator